MRVAVVVDNPIRDLRGSTLLAARLVVEGAEHVYLVPLQAQARELPRLAADAVVVNYLRPNNTALVRHLLGLDLRVIVLDTEGGVMPDFESFDRTLSTDQWVRDRVAAYCAWGSRVADHLVEGGWYGRDQVAVTGSPRFDFYSRPWSHAISSELPVPADKPLILVNGNFPLANPQFQTAVEEARMLVERFGFEREHVCKSQHAQQAAMEGLCDAAARLAGAHDVVVVYRPHPFERLETYRELLPELANLHVIRDGPVDAWILRSTAVVQRSCTTAIEATMAGVPALEASWLPNATPMPAVDSVSRHCATYEEMDEMVAALVQGRELDDPAPSADATDVIGGWFHAGDGRANERVAEVVLRGGRRSTSDGRSFPLGSTPKELLRSVLPPEVANLRRGRRLTGARVKRFGAPEVQTILDRITSAPGSGLPRFRVAPTGRGDYTLALPFTRSVRVDLPS